MFKSDLINALFEMGGATAVGFSVLRALKEREIVGVSGAHVMFFMMWGMWNLFYYPNLDQYLSFSAGVLLTIVNTAYAVLWLAYRRR